ncbi:conserved protein of unknown function [Paenibacillus alvei]|uniref:Uncharacterized protein n=2 Tax=Paenibacillus alvei TaxID=44250 RepID=A0A383REF9_PAEAL|nr:conserved protein of unknown function [Paenibacillus alvei]
MDKKKSLQLILTGALIVAVLFFLFRNYSSPAHTTSFIEIIEKGTKTNSNEPWAIVKNPLDAKAESFKLILDTFNTQNLLVVGKTYLVTYEHFKNDNTCKLVIIDEVDTK